MTFPTKIFDLSAGPVDLMADPDIAAGIAVAGVNGRGVWFQNIGAETVYYAERADAPARSDKGHSVDPRDGLVLRLIRGATPGAWVWAASTGSVAVTPNDP